MKFGRNGRIKEFGNPAVWRN